MFFFTGETSQVPGDDAMLITCLALFKPQIPSWLRMVLLQFSCVTGFPQKFPPSLFPRGPQNWNALQSASFVQYELSRIWPSEDIHVSSVTKVSNFSPMVPKFGHKQKYGVFFYQQTPTSLPLLERVQQGKDQSSKECT